MAIKANVAVIATLQSQIVVLEKRLQERVRPRPQYALLTTVPGIGQKPATVIVLETGPIDRFDADELAGLDQRGDDRPVLAAAVRACKQRVLAIERDRADGRAMREAG